MLIAYFWEIELPIIGYFTVLPALLICGLMLGAIALFMSSVIKQLENFAGVMNFVIFPMFLRPRRSIPNGASRANPLLYEICRANPFTHAVELIRFAMYGQLEPVALAVVLAFTAVFLTAAIYAYNPSRECWPGEEKPVEEPHHAHAETDPSRP